MLEQQKVQSFTLWLRNMAVWLWSSALALVVFDRLYIPLLHWEVKISYFLFAAAALFCFWAEKREYSTRWTLYRIHDLAFYTPWKYLFLFFLWVNIFAWFTANPLDSLVYSAVGWFNLFAVGFSANIIFCERTMHGLALEPKRLRLAFLAYLCSLGILFFNLLLDILTPAIKIPYLWKNSIDLGLYFMIGFVFLLWDFVNPKRHILPKWGTGLVLITGTTFLFFIKEKASLVGILFSAVLFVALAIYKKIRFIYSFLFLLGFIFFGIALLLVLLKLPEAQGVREKLFTLILSQKDIVYRRLITWREAYYLSQASHFLGIGIGLSKFHRGIWPEIFAETGIVGIVLYSIYFLSLLKSLFFVRRARQIVVSDIAKISVLCFLVIAAHFLPNAVSLEMWVWYALWGIFASTALKKEFYRKGQP